jgi:hypothetical protein
LCAAVAGRGTGVGRLGEFRIGHPAIGLQTVEDSAVDPIERR